jgi:hypothetical protein
MYNPALFEASEVIAWNPAFPYEGRTQNTSSAGPGLSNYMPQGYLPAQGMGATYSVQAVPSSQLVQRIYTYTPNPTDYSPFSPYNQVPNFGPPAGYPGSPYPAPYPPQDPYYVQRLQEQVANLQQRLNEQQRQDSGPPPYAPRDEEPASSGRPMRQIEFD